jgi:hypothetical protein
MNMGANARRTLASLIVVLVVVIVMAAAVHTSLGQTNSLRSTVQVSGWTGADDQIQCLRAEFHRDVPKGSRVWIGETASSAHAQLVGEIAALWAAPQASLSTAQWSVFTVTGSECFGLTLRVDQLS